MNCVVRQFRLSGGAPRSIFEYLCILKRKGYSITTLAFPEEPDLLHQYKNEFNTLVERKDFQKLWDKRQFIAAYNELRWEYRLLKKERPELVIALGEVNGFFFSYLCRKLQIPLIIVIAGGDLPQQYLIKDWCFGEVICFSKENEETISKYYNSESIHVIANRISIKKTFFDLQDHYANPQVFNILIVSRIINGKIKSIYEFLNRLSSEIISSRIEIRIAGGGDAIQEFEEEVEKYRNKFRNITLLGHVDNLIPQFEWAHMVVGKGRSVIEPIMMGRIGCVIGEDGKSSVCTKNSFQNLYHYNFAGRNIEQTIDNDFIKTIEQVVDGKYNYEKIEEMAGIVGKEYSSVYLEDKFSKILNTRLKHNNKSQSEGVFLFGRIIRFIFNKIEARFNKK